MLQVSTPAGPDGADSQDDGGRRLTLVRGRRPRCRLSLGEAEA
ncbi:hypothetical protein HMPREF0058_0486 [Actinomyces urogenitalis DSM 15434]|uniref:Uncharacterized protein n=1 Tax=Actinomyces urogenitalis DSM 15434 TaxID=525246 RepID=C0W3P2_9ACTO|nr:hypothetical protein HMPREF0058_0486 [Actinomyces urogenitalis DSM 15434]